MNFRDNLEYKESYYMLKIELSLDSVISYNRLINWVIGEFDLFLKEETMDLKVYFPNGWFNIMGVGADYHDVFNLRIEVIGKSRQVCVEIIDKLEQIYNHAKRFSELNVVV